jgi:hypothetical protein
VTPQHLEPERVSMRTIVIVAGESGAIEGPWVVAARGREVAACP